MRLPGLLFANTLLLICSRNSYAQDEDIPGQPTLPDKFQVSFYYTDAGTAALNLPGRLVTVAKDGSKLGIHFPNQNSSAYYDTQCLSTDSNSTSAYVFNPIVLPEPEYNFTGGMVTHCLKAPKGRTLSPDSGDWDDIKAVAKSWDWNGLWKYGGRHTSLQGSPNPVDFWTRSLTPSCSVLSKLFIDSVTSDPVTLITAPYSSSDSFTWEFIRGSFMRYNNSEDVVLLAHIPVDGVCNTSFKDTLVIEIPAKNTQSCRSPAARKALEGRSLGSKPVPPNWKEMEALFKDVYNGLQIPTGYTDNPKYNLPYQFQGGFSQTLTSYYMGNQLYRADLPDVWNQRSCGSCWAVSTVVTLSSVYSQKSGGHYTLSAQFFLDCYTESLPALGGCGGGFPPRAFDFFVGSVGSIAPLELDYPYAAVPGQCNMAIAGVNTSITHYSRLNTTAEIKDAVYNHGAVQVSLNAVNLQSWSPSTSAAHVGERGSGKAIDFPNFLGLGVSCTSSEGDRLDHAVNIIGWGDCEYANKNRVGESSIIKGQCWIIQNSWGSSVGYKGLYFVAMDMNSDCGIHRFPYIPIASN
ncbi:hypothetical protein CEUSTIGMA_g13521.t1 [Chlamydomonas eustigma]|uniref:Peptidase C1A papain C-terminal domain-containing protein n=1 Tax=Chlamydomonas eustigma TaxID=1157962 RepID=A0A250XT21_9CHLO|nr:hypothetical protein CEUSTIGMA_g13521.t1 [Chlamydomonas eustigma]|eukprot:GAX86109.1 hypothetical protein CEUSTIGMA_g13521.t1 [Chlamydomonas eustigma]